MDLLKKSISYFSLTVLALLGFCYIKTCNYTLKYISILGGLLIPLFITIEISDIIFSIIKKEKIFLNKILTLILLAITTIIIYVFLLENNQANILINISGIFSIFLFIISIIFKLKHS